MANLTSTIKRIAPGLVPFIVSYALYFKVYGGAENPGDNLYLLAKASPMVSLIGFVYLHRKDAGGSQVYAERVLMGLVASVIGDMFMVFAKTQVNYLIAGMITFGIAHGFYLAAFGFKPFKGKILAVCLTVFGAIFLSTAPKLNVYMQIAVGLYGGILMTMVWRALSRVRNLDDIWTWTKMCALLGSLSFALSDSILTERIFNKPDAAATEKLQLIVMITYYLGQLGITLSVINSHGVKVPSLKLK